MKKNTIIFVAVLACFIIAVGIYSCRAGEKREMLVYSEVLDETAVTVDGNPLRVRDMAFYIAYEEDTVEKQALTYDETDTNAYWKLHINGEFVKVSAGEAALEMAVHDEIFYQLALANEVELSDEEQEILRERQSDFWTDLPETAKERIVVSEEELDETMEKMALAQKYQTIYANMQNGSYEEYDFNGDGYQILRENHEVEINNTVWDRLDFGNITLEH